MKALALPDCTALAAELASQPEFFGIYRDELPELHPPVLTDARYSGARCDDEQLNLRVGAMRLLGLSDRAIERECGVDRRTIPHRLAWLERQARIPALKDRVAQRTGDLAERSAMVLSGLLDRAQDDVSVELAAMIKSVATAHGITSEKMLLLTGQATEIVEHRSRAGRDEIEAWARSVAVEVEAVEVTSTAVDAAAPKTAPAGQTDAPIDFPSGGQAPVSAENDTVSADGHGMDTAPRPKQATETGPGQPGC